MNQFHRDVARLKAKLEKATNRAVATGFRRVLMRAATPTLARAKSLAPKRHGFLRRALVKSAEVRIAENVAVAKVGGKRGQKFPHPGRPGKKVSPGSYLHLIERGFSTSRKTKRGTSRGGRVAANPFLARAAQSSRPESLAIIRDGIGDEIQKQVAKVADKFKA